MNENNLQLQYATQSMQYTTQFIASMSDQEVILDCGSVVVPTGADGQKQLPIHSRLALPWPAVHRLHQLLGELIQANQTADVSGPPASRASLPPLMRGGDAVPPASTSTQPAPHQG